MDAMMGLPPQRFYADDPCLKAYYDIFQVCRASSLIVFRKPTGGEAGEERIVVIQWPTGFSLLPLPGGVEHQDYLTMRLLSAFLRGEQIACQRLMDQ